MNAIMGATGSGKTTCVFAALLFEKIAKATYFTYFFYV